MRLLANDLGPAKVAFLCYPFRSREVRPFWIDSQSDHISAAPRMTRIQLSFKSKFVSREITLNNLASDPLTRLKKNSISLHTKKRMRVLSRRFAKRLSAMNSVCSLSGSASGFAPRVQVRKSL
jgi:hypothetical protein